MDIKMPLIWLPVLGYQCLSLYVDQYRVRSLSLWLNGQGRPSHGGNEAEIFILTILRGKEIFLVHSTLAQFLSLHRKRRNVYMMKVLYGHNISTFPPGKAKFHVLKITSYLQPHRKAKLSCTKIYFFPPERLSFL